MQGAEDKLNRLKDPSLVLIFTYAPAGLGHLRVTDALYHGLPKGITPLLLGSQDKSITYLHRLTSVSPLGRSIGEWFQSGLPERLFTCLYSRFLTLNSNLLFQQMLTLLDQRYVAPKKVIIVATHFALAHQLASIKDKLALARKIKIYLVVQVTDDSPQSIWYVPQADLIFVPSSRTREDLLTFARKNRLRETQIEVIPYPLSPRLTSTLSAASYQERVKQMSLEGKTDIQVAIPISGAAVGLDFTASLLEALHSLSSRFIFHIISKKASFTKSFIQKIEGKQFATVFSSVHDREVVDAYEKLYQEKVIALEITKPSEQAFKALLAPIQVGGTILLFSAPVGRQEYDNLEFLTRKGLVPFSWENEKLWEKTSDAAGNKKIQQFRGFCLPPDPLKSAKFIFWCLKTGIFARMMQTSNELGADGVDQFWQKVCQSFLG